MSLCCSSLFELAADARTWPHLPCTARSFDVSCGRWSKPGQPGMSERVSAESWPLALWCEVPLLIWPFEFKAFVRNPEKSKPNRSGWLCLCFKEKLMSSGRHTYAWAWPQTVCMYLGWNDEWGLFPVWGSDTQHGTSSMCQVTGCSVQQNAEAEQPLPHHDKCVLFPGAFSSPPPSRSAISRCRAAPSVTSQVTHGHLPGSLLTLLSSTKPIKHTNLYRLRKARQLLGRPLPFPSSMQNGLHSEQPLSAVAKKSSRSCAGRAGRGAGACLIAPCSALTSSGTIALQHWRSGAGEIRVCFATRLNGAIVSSERWFILLYLMLPTNLLWEKGGGPSITPQCVVVFFPLLLNMNSFCCQVNGLAAAVTNISFTVTSWLTPLNENQLWHNPRRP